MKKINLLVALIILLQCSALSQNSNSDEKKIIASIRTALPQHLRFLESLVNINSGTLNIKGVKAVGDALRVEFNKIGFNTEWINMPDSMKRAGHLVASIKGKKGKKLFLIGHLDTVFEPDMPANPYRKINDSTATGQGVEDMKGGDVIILAALEALHKNGLLKDVTITAYFTGDEEKTGSPIELSRGDFIERAKNHDMALAFEGAISSTVATGRRGIGGWKLKVYGKQAHSSGVFNNNFGAIYEASRIIDAFRRELDHEQFLTVNPGVIIGGTDVNYDSSKTSGSVSSKTNIISPSCVVQGDIRYLTQKQNDTARAKMLRIVNNNNLPGTRAEITFSDGIPSMEPEKGNTALAEMLSKISVDLGYEPMIAGDPGSRGAGDISYVSKYLQGSLDGLGAEGWGGHAPGETMSLKTFERQVQRAAILIYRLTR
jgi:glutamate carboxypeptidase